VYNITVFSTDLFLVVMAANFVFIYTLYMSYALRLGLRSSVMIGKRFDACHKALIEHGT